MLYVYLLFYLRSVLFVFVCSLLLGIVFIGSMWALAYMFSGFVWFLGMFEALLLWGCARPVRFCLWARCLGRISES